MKKRLKKLALSRETLRDLQQDPTPSAVCNLASSPVKHRNSESTDPSIRSLFSRVEAGKQIRNDLTRLRPWRKVVQPPRGVSHGPHGIIQPLRRIVHVPREALHDPHGLPSALGRARPARGRGKAAGGLAAADTYFCTRVGPIPGTFRRWASLRGRLEARAWRAR